jgi:hypothetical protein
MDKKYKIISRLNEIQLILEKNISYLFERWQCEKEFEDWSDYVAAMKKNLPSDCEFVKCSKKPFGIVFKINGCDSKFISLATATYTQWKMAK